MDAGDGTRTAKDRARPALVVTLGSLLLAVVKGGGALATGSAALLASAVDSAGDALMSLGNWMAVRAADRPADEGHPFGHGKLEHLAGLAQAIVIAASGAFVVREAFVRFGEHAELARPGLGLGVTIVSLLAAWGFSNILQRAARKHDSPALAADSLHYTTDLFTHCGVLIVFVLHLGIVESPWIDPAVAVIIAALILHAAWGLLAESVHRLMDQGLERAEVRAVEDAIASFGEPVRGYHDLLTRRSGPDRFVQVHVEIDADVSFREAHALVERIEAAIEGRLPRTQVIIHADPWPEDPSDPHQPHAPDRRF